ncbi:PfkB family carbohydrate kinase [Amycolatopsis alkalitolerans]|nr:PfkB family carbohydrate kinase [Amycolatopsis alkalitolerans]
MTELLTVGRVNLDLYSQQTGAEFAEARTFEAMIGGSPSNIAVAAARLGVRTAVFTAVGDDLVGDWVLRAFERAGVDTTYVARKPGVHTSLALLGQIPPDDFPRTFYRDNPADIHLTVDEAASLPLAQVRAVLVSADVFARGSTADAAAWIMRTCREHDTTVYIDLDLRPEHWPKPDEYSLLVGAATNDADVVLGTAEEFAALQQTDPQGIELSGEKQVMVLKRGGDGARVLTSEREFEAPVFDVPVASTVGAGDAFAAGLISGRIHGSSWEASARLASACGAITVSRFGCSEGFPTLGEVAELLGVSHGS